MTWEILWVRAACFKLSATWRTSISAIVDTHKLIHPRGPLAPCGILQARALDRRHMKLEERAGGIVRTFRDVARAGSLGDT